MNMRFALMGTDGFADALAQAGSAVPGLEMPRCASADELGTLEADAAILACPADKMEAAAQVAAARGMDAAIPGWFAAERAALERLHARFRAQGRRLRLMFPARCAPNVRDVHRILRAEKLGRIGVLNLFLQWAEPGMGALHPLAEGLCLAEDWLGKPAALHGIRSAAGDVDCAALTARFESGALLNLQCVCAPGEGAWKTEYELSGSEGNLVYDGAEARSVRISGTDARFPLLGTRLCPLESMLRALPAEFAAGEAGAPEEGLALAAQIERAFAEGGEAHA